MVRVEPCALDFARGREPPFDRRLESRRRPQAFDVPERPPGALRPDDEDRTHGMVRAVCKDRAARGDSHRGNARGELGVGREARGREEKVGLI